MMDEWSDTLVRRVAMEVANGRQWKGTLVCTSYDPKKHAVKGMIVPHGIESGWIPLASIHTHQDSGTGVFIGPRPGDAQKLDGDQLDIEFDLSDPNTIVARHRMSQTENPPQVQSGEMLHVHEKGTTTLYKQDGSVTFTHFSKKGTLTWDKDGHVTVDTKGGNHTVKTSGGQLTVDSGGAALNITSGGGQLNIN